MKKVVSYLVFAILLALLVYWNFAEQSKLTRYRMELKSIQQLGDTTANQKQLIAKLESQVNLLGSIRAMEFEIVRPYYSYLVSPSAENFFEGFSDHFVLVHPDRLIQHVRRLEWERNGQASDRRTRKASLLRLHLDDTADIGKGDFLLYAPEGEHRLGIRILPYCDLEQMDDLDWQSGICHEVKLESKTSHYISLNPNEDDRLELTMSDQTPIAFPVRLKQSTRFTPIATEHSPVLSAQRPTSKPSQSFVSRFVPSQLSKEFFLGAERGILSDPDGTVVLSERKYETDKAAVMVQIYVKSESQPACEAHNYFALQSRLYSLDRDELSWVFDCLSYDEDRDLYVFKNPFSANTENREDLE